VSTAVDGVSLSMMVSRYPETHHCSFLTSISRVHQLASPWLWPQAERTVEGLCRMSSASLSNTSGSSSRKPKTQSSFESDSNDSGPVDVCAVPKQASKVEPGGILFANSQDCPMTLPNFRLIVQEA
jgi:hypothetical protein